VNIIFFYGYNISVNFIYIIISSFYKIFNFLFAYLMNCIYFYHGNIYTYFIEAYDFFNTPHSIAQKQYEALRMYFFDKHRFS